MAEKNNSHEIKIIRVYDAPLKTVWEAWADPEQAAKWMGPRGFTLTTHSKDLRAGGHWSYTMHGPDGTDYKNKTIYYEVEPMKRLVYDHGGNDDRPPLFRVTVLFSETKGKTKMDMSMAFATSEVAEEMRKFIKKAGGEGTWDRLGEYLEKKRSGKEVFMIHRSFDTSIDKMFDLWTDPNLLMKWLPPAGFTMKVIRAETKVGGTTFFSMGNPENTVIMYGRVHYLEIKRPDLIVSTQEFCDEEERPARHPMAPTWPASMLRIVSFSEEAPNRTRVSVTWAEDGKWSAEELETFIKGRAGMTGGWTGSFDKLEALIAG